jgi:hypothetical protein
MVLVFAERNKISRKHKHRPKAEITEAIVPPNLSNSVGDLAGSTKLQEWSLIGHFCQHKIILDEKVYSGPETRYFAVWKDNPKFVCEITRTAYETLTNRRTLEEWKKKNPLWRYYAGLDFG